MELVGIFFIDFLFEDCWYFYGYWFFKYVEEFEGIQFIGNSCDVEVFNCEGKFVLLCISLLYIQVVGELLFILFIVDISE